MADTVAQGVPALFKRNGQRQQGYVVGGIIGRSSDRFCNNLFVEGIEVRNRQPVGQQAGLLGNRLADGIGLEFLACFNNTADSIVSRCLLKGCLIIFFYFDNSLYFFT